VAPIGEIAHRLEGELGALEGDPTPLEGGITNRNFRAVFGGRSYVIRLAGRETELLGIDRRAEAAAAGVAAELGIAPRVAAAGSGYLVTEYIESSPIEEGGLDAALEQLARALRLFHDSGLELPVRFHVGALLEDYGRLTSARGGMLPEEWTRARALVERIYGALAPAGEQPCHNDLLPGNIIRADGGRVMIVDWEYAAMGDPRFDLGNLAVNNALDERAQDRLLGAYLGRPARDAERAGLQLARVLSDAREAAWGVLQGVISELDFDFGRYAGEHFERMLGAVEDPDFESWLAAAGG